VVARTQEPLYNLKEQYPNQVEVVVGDVRDVELGEKAVHRALCSFGQLDGLVLNHGILGQIGNIADADWELWKCGFEVNLISCVAFVSSSYCLVANRQSLITRNQFLGKSRSPVASTNKRTNHFQLLRCRGISNAELGFI
jgi:NAD(P)-dependent dehydrogenase (short-subunit alcohol dehydrogenase family)